MRKYQLHHIDHNSQAASKQGKHESHLLYASFRRLVQAVDVAEVAWSASLAVVAMLAPKSRPTPERVLQQSRLK